MRTTFWIALLMLVAGPNHAEELLFSAQVQQVTLTPDGVGSCAPACAPKPDNKGVRQVCISNSPGCEVAEVKVVKNHVGTATGVVVLRARIGEWDELHIPIRSNPILVHVVDGRTSWAPLVERGGVTLFDATSMRKIGKVDVRQLPRDEEGLVPLDVLIARMRAH